MGAFAFKTKDSKALTDTVADMSKKAGLMVVPVFDMYFRIFRFEGEEPLVYCVVEPKIPKLYYVALIPAALAVFFDSTALWVVAGLFAAMSLFWLDHFYFWLIKRKVQAAGHDGFINRIPLSELIKHFINDGTK